MKDDVIETTPEEEGIIVLEKGTDSELDMLGICCCGTYMPIRAL